MSRTNAANYRPDIDALRALAVLPVVIFHLNSSWLPGGFLGVDVFFVISGFLITGLLLRELEQGKVDLLAFWRRRILRILPALIVMVWVTWVAGQFILYPPDRRMLAINSAAALVSIANITHWRNYGGYWGADAHGSPLLHTWSLGVEEQFYLFYPVALLVTWAIFTKRTQIVVWVGLVAGLALYLYVLQRSPAAAFFLFPTRAWELLAGAVAAFWCLGRSPGPRVAASAAYAGLVLIVAGYLVASKSEQALGTVLAVAGATAVVGAGPRTPLIHSWFTLKPVIFIGLVSYSLYLWHWPVIVIGQTLAENQGSVLVSACLFLTSLILAVVSWRYVEKPLRAKRSKQVALATLCVAIVSAAVFFFLRDFNTRASDHASAFAATHWEGESFNVTPPRCWVA